MTDLDALLADAPIEPPTVTVATARRCRRHEWLSNAELVYIGKEPRFPDAGDFCERCEKPRDLMRSRQGKTNRQRGNAQEREWCKRLGLTRKGQFGGPEDGLNAMFVGQAKSMATGRFPSWMSNELSKLPRTDGRIPILGVLETPGMGYRPRRLVVLEEADWCALHGPVGQP